MTEREERFDRCVEFLEETIAAYKEAHGRWRELRGDTELYLVRSVKEALELLTGDSMG